MMMMKVTIKIPSYNDIIHDTMILVKMIEGLMFELAVTVLKATRYAARTVIVSVPLTR